MPYEAWIPSFGLPWGFIAASNTVDPRQPSREDVDKAIATRLKGGLQYFDGETHQGQYKLGKHTREALAKGTRIIEDNHPLYTYN